MTTFLPFSRSVSGFAPARVIGASPALVSISASDDGAVWAVAPGGTVFEYVRNRRTWEPARGSLRLTRIPMVRPPGTPPPGRPRAALSVGSTKMALAVDASGGAHEYRAGRWQAIALSPSIDPKGLSCRAEGWIAGIDADGRVYVHAGALGWLPASGVVGRI